MTIYCLMQRARLSMLLLLSTACAAAIPLPSNIDLTGQQPSRRVSIEGDFVQRCDIASVNVDVLENPTSQPISLYFYLIALSGAKDMEGSRKALMGTFSLFPPTQGGHYLVSVREARSTLMSHAAKHINPVYLKVEIRPIHGKQLHKLHLKVQLSCFH